MARLIVSPEAQTDLDAILDHLTEVAGKPVARRYGQRFHAAFRHLIDFPETGARRPRLGTDMRIWVVAPFLIFYRFSIDDDSIRVIRLLHGRRNITVRLFRV
jgi:plasmid stabilization system protein ParE